ncbi:SMI1/KNR4 family protein [Paenibacillus thiaminolyticus]|uniref:SMI1/KNR4 family protein n=1 Tax=Paenibacillus thiaminolyticus TaxID=49283 RepID=A0A3A3GD56_PANTH|nr:SMI1/KNR4 family protein [Paenibacillus thiaminolyticus]RJG21443.1 SMI1/KNR4 family protein [Paenibacillus thiaminolyticus]
MEVKDGSIVYPLPDDTLLAEKEKKWRIKLPDAYKQFIKKYNGVTPTTGSFLCNNHSYAIDRFLCILKVTGERDDEFYDIGVVRTQLEERIVSDEDLVGTELLPIAVLFAGDFICLDYRNNDNEPFVCVWNHEESSDLDPVTYFTSESFEEFLTILTE